MQRTSQTSVLVAGGAGFIGSYLCKALLESCQVFALDNLVKGEKESIEPFFENENFVFIEHDLKRKLPSDFPHVDYIFHLAGISGYLGDETMALETLLVNSLGTQHLLEWAQKCQAKFLLASSFRVYEGTISKATLENYFGESKLAETRFSHREAKRFSENLCFEYFKKENLDTRIVRLADVYGPGMPLDIEEELSLIFKALVEGESLKIKGSGEAVLYPTFITDVVSGLLRAMFTQSSKGKIFTLINPQKLTVNEAVHKIEEIVTKIQTSRKLKIEFVPQEVPSAFQASEGAVLKSQEELGWRAKIGFKEGVKETLAWLKLSSKKEKPVGKPGQLDKSTSEPAEQKKKISKPKLRMPFLKSKFSSLKQKVTAVFKKNFLFSILPLFFFLVIISPLFFFSSNTFAGIRKLEKAYENFQKGEVEVTSNQAWQAGVHFKNARGILLQFNGVLQPISSKGVNRVNDLLVLGENLSGVLLEGSRVVEKQKELLALMLQKKEGYPEAVLADLKMSLDLTTEKLALVQAQLDSSLKPLFSLTTFSLGEKLENIAGELPNKKAELRQAREVVLLLPELLGFESKKTYLLVFQNNMELRPTGGFIGSFGLLIFDKGKLLDFEVQDIYVADGQLKGHVEPPAELKKYLGEANWYFRDANWDPDWTKTAPRLEWFLEKEMKRKADGVIGLNLNVAQEILRVIDPVVLPDWQETITADNLFERAEYYAEIDSFPGSTQKKDFLGELSQQMMMTIQELKDEEFLKLGQSLTELLEEKQLLLYFHQKDLAQLVRENFWDGSLRKIDYQQEDKGLQDFLMLVEANLGVNKANFFVKRKVTHKLTLNKDLEVKAEVLINYQNESPGETWPGGIYKNYLRIYLPQNVKTVKVMLKKEVEKKFTSLAASKIKKESSEDKKIIGFYFEVPTGEKLEVKLEYSLGELGIKGNQGILAFYFQKQPGVGGEPLKFQVDYPSYLQVLKTEPAIEVLPQNLFFETDQQKDKLFTVYFYKG